MGDEQRNILELFRKSLSGGRNGKILRFLLNVLSGTPTIGGVFSATVSAWAEANQQRINELMAQFATLTDERITRLEKSLVAANDPSHVIAAYITFNPNSAELIDSSGVAGLTDGGTLDFAITFEEDYDNYIFNYYGSGKVVPQVVHQSPGSIRFLFEAPCPDIVTIVFFEQQAIASPRLPIDA